MKKTLRASLTIVMTGGLLLAATGCMAPTPGASDAQASPGQPAPTAQQHSFPAGGEQHISFESPMRVERTVPAKWKGGDGWHNPGVQQLVALPHHIAYSFRNMQNGKAGFRIYNDEGKAVATIDSPEEIKSGMMGLVVDKVVTVWQGGEMYTVYIQGGNDGNGQGVLVLTAFDEDANQTVRKVFYPKYEDADMETGKGTITFTDMDSEGDDRIFDPATGEFRTVPVAAEGGKWAGQVNGVDLYFGEHTIQNDKFAVPAVNFAPLGKYISVYLADDKGSATGFCEIIDPQTGKTIDGNDGGCAVPAESNSFDDPQSPLNGFILAKQNKDPRGTNITPSDVLFLPSKKSLTIELPTDLNVYSVDADGTFYAEGKGDSVVSLNPDSGFAPKVEEGAQAVPILITPNGIAVFHADDDTGYDGDLFFVLPKK